MTGSMTPRVGDLVVCHDAEHRRNLHLPDDPGLVVGLRKGQAKVFFPSVVGESWMPHHLLSRIRHPESAHVPPWMQRVWFAAHTLGAIAIEVERFGSDGNAVRIYHQEIEAPVVDAVREGLDDELRYYAIGPAGLHKLEASLAFVTRDREPPVPKGMP